MVLMNKKKRLQIDFIAEDAENLLNNSN